MGVIEPGDLVIVHIPANAPRYALVVKLGTVSSLRVGYLIQEIERPDQFNWVYSGELTLALKRFDVIFPEETRILRGRIR